MADPSIPLNSPAIAACSFSIRIRERPFEWEFVRGRQAVQVETSGPLTFTDPKSMLTECVAGTGVAQIIGWGVGESAEERRTGRPVPGLARRALPAASLSTRRASIHRRRSALSWISASRSRMRYRGRRRVDDIAVRGPHPPILKLASAAILTMSESLAPSATICTGRSRPTISGPMTVAPPSSCNILVEMEAE